MERQVYQLRIAAIIVLVILHGVGLWGFSNPEWESYFRNLTPYHLLITAVITILFHQPWNKRIAIYLGVIGFLGWGIEVIGVQTGLVFGAYHYGEVLGWAPGGVPLLIGLNWAVLVYAVGMIFLKVPLPYWVKAGIGSAILIIFDFGLEQFAVSKGLWIWEADVIPFQNYAGWFIMAYLFLIVFYRLGFSIRNPIALPFLLIQAMFFYLGWVIGIW